MGTYEIVALVGELIGSLATVAVGLWVIIKLMPQLGKLIATIGEWRGEVNTKLDSLDEHTRASNERNVEDHGKIYSKLSDHGERLARIEGKDE